MTAAIIRCVLLVALVAGCDSVIDSPAPTYLPKGSESSTPTQTSGGSDEEAALAAELGFEFADSVSRGDLAAAYNLLCQEDRDSVTLENFSEDAPASITFEPGERIRAGAYSGTFTFDGDETAVVFVRDAAGVFCVTQED